MVSFAYKNIKVNAWKSEVASRLKERDSTYDEFCASRLINLLKNVDKSFPSNPKCN
jgi:hypothetical protein